jgi:hypothetical protein
MIGEDQLLIDTGIRFQWRGFSWCLEANIIFPGCVVESAAPNVLFNDPQQDRTKLFLSKILSH